MSKNFSAYFPCRTCDGDGLKVVPSSNPINPGIEIRFTRHEAGTGKSVFLGRTEVERLRTALYSAMGVAEAASTVLGDLAPGRNFRLDGYKYVVIDPNGLGLVGLTAQDVPVLSIATGKLGWFPRATVVEPL